MEESQPTGLLEKWRGLSPFMLSVLRIVAAFMFVPSGTSKLFSWPVPMPGGMKLEMFSQVWVGGVLEVVGGLLVLLGLFTRPTAFVLSGMMAVAYWQFHAPGGFWPSVNGGTPAALYCFVYLYLSVAGPGPWSLDAFLGKKVKAASPAG